MKRRSLGLAAHLLSPILWLGLCGCEKKSVTESSPKENPATRMLAGDIAESVLPEMRYKRITDRNGGTVQGGSDFPHEILRKDAETHKPQAVQWAGIKSLDPILGQGGDTYYRYRIIAELYADEESAKRRDESFDATYRKHVEREMEMVSKAMIPCVHFTHGRIFYLLTTDMAASSDPNEAGRIRFALLRQLTD